MNRLLIFGLGEFAEIAFEYFSFDSDYEVVGFTADSTYTNGIQEKHGLPVVAFEDAVRLFDPARHAAFAAIPASRLNRDRRAVCDRVEAAGYSLASYVSSRTFRWRNVPVGKNTFIFENNTLQPFTAIGDRCVLWSGNHVGHRTVIENDVFVTSHVVISGYCTIGSGSFLGVNSTINDHVRIAPDCLIGAGAHVNRGTDPGLIYVGSPAKPIPGRSSLDAKL